MEKSKRLNKYILKKQNPMKQRGKYMMTKEKFISVFFINSRVVYLFLIL